MKICLINNLYKPYNRGGAERVVETMADKFKENGHDVFIITTKPRVSKQKIDNSKQIADNCLPAQTGKQKIYYLSSLYYYLNKVPKFLRIFWHIWDMFDIIKYFKIKHILKIEKPDIIISHNLKGLGYLLPLAIKRLKIKHIHYLHDIQLLHPSGLMYYGKEKILESLGAKIYQYLCRWIFNSPIIVISPSDWLLKLHEQKKYFIKSKKLKLPNYFANPAIKMELPKKDDNIFRFIFVGQIEFHKGVDLLIKAFKKINNKNSELIVVGNGSQLDEIKKISKRFDNIKLLGWVDPELTDNLLSAANCLVVPSLCYENSPTVIYLAMASGLPVIASDIGGIGELVGNNTGILFKPGDIDDLAEKINWAINHKHELEIMGINGSAVFSSRKNESSIMEILIK